MKLRAMIAAAVVLAGATGVRAAEDRGPAPPKATGLSIKGQIERANITFTLEFDLQTFALNQELALAGGEVVLDELASPGDGVKLRYDREGKTYFASFRDIGRRHVTARFAARAAVMDGGDWRQASFEVPASWQRQLELVCDRADLEVLFPEAMRLERQVADGRLSLTAVMGPGRPFTVRWKPQLAELDAKLVLASHAVTIATAGAGSLRLDTLFNFQISQGKLTELSFALPAGLSVTQVRGEHIRDWRIEDVAAPGAAPPGAGAGDAKPDAGAARRLVVVINRPQTAQYALQVLAETPLPKFPAQIDLPVIQPEGGIRAGGALAVGTDSAIQLLVKKSAGLSQIDAAAFPRAVLTANNPRPLPAGKAFYYTYATSPYQMTLGLDDIVPSLDAAHRLVVGLKQDDMVIDVSVEADVRDAPIRSLTLDIPGGFLLAGVSGAEVVDHVVRTGPGGSGPRPRQEVEVHFRQPVIGRTVIALRLEMGRSPLDQPQRLDAISVRGAKNERGYLVLATEEGVQLQTPTAKNLREVHTGSVPMRVADAQFAYRFRDADWSLEMAATRRASGVRVEAFQLLSLGDGVAYGSVAVNYFITGSPVDELAFHVPPQLQNVEFVGRDVRRWTQDPADPARWIVKLQRKVIGDYNLGITYTQRYGANGAAGPDGSGQVLVGGIDCDAVATQTGYIAVASHLDLNLKLAAGSAEPGLLEVDRDELPANYRLLVNAPLLRTYKYVAGPHRATLNVSAYERGSLLPVVIELMDAATTITTSGNGPAETVTTVRYKIKNSSSQFLALGIPKDASVWQTKLITRDATGQETSRRLPASVDKARNLLLVPLERNRNPNDPITLEIELGQKHPSGHGRIRLTAPTSDVQSTFGQWTLTAGPEWSLFPVGGTMVAQARPVRHGGLAAVMRSAAVAWTRGINAWLDSAGPLVAAVAVLLALVLVLALHWRWIVGVPALLALLLAVWIGLMAAGTHEFNEAFRGGDDLSSLSLTQAVSLDPQAALTVEAALVPAWRQHATWAGMYAAPVAALVCLGLALFVRRLRPAFLALAVVALALGASQFAIFRLLLGHLLTWGLPALLAAYAIWRFARTPMQRRVDAPTPPPVSPIPPVPPPAAAAVLLALLLLLPSCATQTVIADTQPVADAIVLDRIDVAMTAEKDSMSLRYHLKINTPRPVRFPLIDEAAVLISPEPASRELGLKMQDGMYYVQVKSKGRYELDLEFLYPLAEAGEDQSRQFQAALPEALTNRVELAIHQVELEVQAPTAVRFDKSEADGATRVRAIVGHGGAIDFAWRPRARQTQLEKITFYSEVTSAVRFDTGLIEARHRLRFQIAQGELKDIRIVTPAAMTVTAVEGAELGAWRFDPATHELEAHLTRGLSADYVMDVVTQIAFEAMPFSTTIGTLRVKDAARQHGTLGLLTSASVFLTLGDHPQAMNVDDFTRAAAGLLKAAPGYDAGSLRHAFRVQWPDEAVVVKVGEVLPEVRGEENAVFTVADDRLIYNGELAVEIAKAGVFGVELKVPAGFDVDALSAAEVSHWDDSAQEGGRGGRVVQVHFNKKVLGRVTIKLALSRPVSELPRRIDVPRVEVGGAVKHAGQVVISSDRGVRLAVAERDGVSELNPAELGIRAAGALAFRLLRPQWGLTLATEVVEPRINVSFVHVAKVSDGMVRHTHYLSYHLFNAGAKVFEVQAPRGVLGLTINGPDVARVEESAPGSGLYRVELGSKWYDRPYPLTVRYETQFDRAAGKVELVPVAAKSVDLQHGHVVVLTTDRVELSPATIGASLQPAEARGIAREFGAGDLSDAAFCYSVASADYALTLDARRHDAASLLEANVLSTVIQTVVAEGGQSATRVQMQLRVLSKRHLNAMLPAGSRVWSLLVNGRSTAPSLQTVSGDRVLLIPLAQAASGELPVMVDLMYVTPAPATPLGRREQFEGPRFDLPLKDVQWSLYLPDGYEYHDFEGTLAVKEAVVRARPVMDYGVQRYEAQVAQANSADLQRAVEYQTLGKKYAQLGGNLNAKAALGNAYNYSVSDPALNEDARVQLQDLNLSQALVGLVSSRSRLRQQEKGVAGNPPNPQPQGAVVQDLGENYNDADAQRIKSSLSKADSDNLELITQRLVAVQEAAAGPVFQLVVNMPLRGRVVEFSRPAQVELNAPMRVSFDAEPVKTAGQSGNWIGGAGLFVALMTLIGLASLASWRPRRAA